MADKFGIVANVISDRVLRTGAKVWLVDCNGGAECPQVIGLSKGGRILMKYTHHKRLENHRAAWIPEHLRDRVIWQWDTKQEAQEAASGLRELWAGVRFFHRDGTLLREGITTSQAFARLAHRHPTIWGK